MITTKTTEQIHAMYEMNNYGETDISKDKWLRVVDVQKEIQNAKLYKNNLDYDCIFGFNTALFILTLQLGLLEEEKKKELAGSNFSSSSSPKKRYPF